MVAGQTFTIGKHPSPMIFLSSFRELVTDRRMATDSMVHANAEPTLSMGSTQCVVWDDGWTAVAVDGSLSAQFEHTVLVTSDGAEILTGFP